MTIKQQFDGSVQRKDCFLCCAAMAAGVTYAEAWARAPEEVRAALRARGAYDKDCEAILASLGFKRDADYRVLYMLPEYATAGFLRNILWGRRALLQVRSRNFAGEMHIVYFDGHALHDPTNGRSWALPEVEPIYVWLFNETGANEN